MSSKERLQIFNLGDDNKVQTWQDFSHPSLGTFSLAHLNAHTETFNQHTVYVTYSHHCFCKLEEGYNDSPDWQYDYDKDPRPFNLKRYELSKKLPALIRNLPNEYIGNAGYGDYAIIPLTSDPNEPPSFYKITFTVYRHQRKIRLHITSAYQINAREKLKKITLEVILKRAKKK